MSDTNYLLMWLEGPLQSWGFDSRFSRRNSLEFPTKSALLGMLCCAMGRGGKQNEWLSRMASLKSTVVAYSGKSKTAFLRDFHVIGAGYDDQNSFGQLMIPRKSDGKKPSNGGPKLTYRYYLQDAFFSAILEVPRDQSEEISQGLVNPVWDLFLGRKNCVPTDFIFRGVFDSEGEALQQSFTIAHEKSLQEQFRVLDGQLEQGEVLILNDVPLEFGEYKKYAQRYVTIVRS